MLGASNVVLGLILLAVVLVVPPLWMLARRHHGMPVLAAHESRERRRDPDFDTDPPD